MAPNLRSLCYSLQAPSSFKLLADDENLKMVRIEFELCNI